MLLHQQEWNYSCGAASAFPAAELSRPEHGIPFSSRLAVQARRNTKTIVEKNNDWLKIDKFSARVKHVGCAFFGRCAKSKQECHSELVSESEERNSYEIRDAELPQEECGTRKTRKFSMTCSLSLINLYHDASISNGTAVPP
jgi:hypothetical protein